jgi:hypothetical protein
MRPAPRLRLLISAAFLFLAIVAQFKSQVFLGFTLHLGLAALSALTGLLSGRAFILITVLAMWVMGFHEGRDMALWLFFTLPLFGFLIVRALPWQAWINSTTTTAGTLLFFYALAHPKMIITDPGMIAIDVVCGILLGLAMFFIFEEMYPPEIARSRAESLRRGYMDRRNF